jgi:hypothetical protein
VILKWTAALVWAVLAATNSGSAPAAPLRAADSGTAHAFRIEQFSPQGHATGVRHVSARFSAAAVALGDPRLSDPFSIGCPAAGKGRWADPRNWAYDFDADLPAGLRCTFSAKRSLHALDGAQLTGARRCRKMARIVSPANGMIIALDPDIPARSQRIPLTAQGARPGMRIRLNGTVLGSAVEKILWAPAAGAQRLTLEDGEGRAVDRILFTVR